MSNGVMTFVKYVFITIIALVSELVILHVINAIAESFSYPTLSYGILIITIPITVVILIWIGWKEITGDYSDYENGNSY